MATDSPQNSISVDQIERTVIDKYLTDEFEYLIFKTENKNDLIRVRTSELVTKCGKNNIVYLKLAPKVKARIDFVAPAGQNFNKHDNNDICFLGVSLQNCNFSRPKLMAQMEWIANHFSSCFVLIGDSIHRIALETYQGEDPIEARDQALNLGQEFQNRERNIFKKFQELCKVDFILCSQIQETHEYQHYFERLKYFYCNDNLFKKSVEQFAKNYHRKKQLTLSDERQLKYLINRSVEYFLEEFAIFACLKKQGIGVLIYPGSFNTLVEIVDGKHPNLLPELKELQIVSLNLKGK